MIYSIIFQVLIQGEPLWVFRPVETLQQCREAVVLVRKEPDVKEAHCGAYIPDSKTEK